MDSSAATTTACGAESTRAVSSRLAHGIVESDASDAQAPRARGPRSEVDTRNWRRLVALLEANPAGVEFERNWAGRADPDSRGVWWHVRVRRRYGVQSGMALTIDGALNVACDNLDIPEVAA